VDKAKLDRNIQHHYRLEKELASILRAANKEERSALYSKVYDRLYSDTPDHPDIMRKQDGDLTRRAVLRRMPLIRRFLKNTDALLEIGAGDCSLSYELSNYFNKVYALDVSRHISAGSKTPSNFELIITDGVNIPFADNGMDIVYSCHAIEHLHPEDALSQTRKVYNILRKNGVYICITPNRITGPHDVSKYFDSTATGLHLKEYSIEEMRDLFAEIGFSKIWLFTRIKNIYFCVPAQVLIVLERTISRLPSCFRSGPCNLLSKILYEVIIVGHK
jgi:ubiquinone/menaquinone biosynthesis C-methylase UbiE